ncbi:MAG: hypothetical protein RLZZ230_891, partial [Candidatus Parcubacteria bacterium]
MQSKFILAIIGAFLIGVAVRTVYVVTQAEVLWLLLVGLVLGVWWGGA